MLRDVTPGVVAGTYGAQPKTFYRVGEDKLRVEEGLDRQNGIHELIVVAEPNVWMINLFTNSGRHMVDPGPTFKTVAPVIGLQGV
ncbi:MAG TPA: hypothetical protein VFA29_12760, partial [Candidatus Baltobacteraceae bacterium]|nr:hypothetical protein [Candidatus Baltobacteraceae bacterium]